MISVQQADFDLQSEYQQMREKAEGSGAVVLFVGLVRDFSALGDVARMELEHYPGMTERCLEEIAEQAKQRWSLNAVRIVHRYGTLSANEQIVLVATSSAHRQDATEANAFIMDYLKIRAPFWKKEVSAAGKSHWVEAKHSDFQTAKQWAKRPN